MTEVEIYELLAAASAMLTVILYGNKYNNAPIYGVLGNYFWIQWSILSESNYMLIMSIIFTLLHLRNYFHMRKIDGKN
jgi:uncharacterized membrane protein